MTTLTVQAKDKRHLSKIKLALKLVDAEFKEENNIISNPELIEKIKLSHTQKQAGTLKTIDPKNIWKSIGL